ncbi:MAG TPA: hypothetical protein VKT52_01385 [Ktedonobacterales bacterium]|nr:hypothetical protein [Ktedonobacterales bacterium]
MTTPEAPGMCPSCHERPADTDVEFSEVVSQTAPSSWGWLKGLFWNQQRIDQQFAHATEAGEQLKTLVSHSTSGRTLSGHVLLCAQCAASYNRSFTLREKAQRAGYIGFAGLVLCVIILLVAAHGAATTAVEILAGVVALASLVVILTGVWMGMRGSFLHRTSSRFLRSPAVVAAAETSDWSYNS